MVKFILIKSPDEWATTKQACRDELVVYLFFSPIYIYIYIYIHTYHSYSNNGKIIITEGEHHWNFNGTLLETYPFKIQYWNNIGIIEGIDKNKPIIFHCCKIQ